MVCTSLCAASSYTHRARLLRVALFLQSFARGACCVGTSSILGSDSGSRHLTTYSLQEGDAENQLKCSTETAFGWTMAVSCPRYGYPLSENPTLSSTPHRHATQGDFRGFINCCQEAFRLRQIAVSRMIGNNYVSQIILNDDAVLRPDDSNYYLI